MGPSTCTTVFLLTLLASPKVCLSQTKPGENPQASASGRVLFGSDNRPIHHAQVEYMLPSAGWTGVLFTDRTGHFNLQGLSPGTYRVKITAPGYEKLEETARVEESTGPSVFHLRKAHAAAALRTEHFVSVQELRMSGEGSKAFEKGTRLLLKGNLVESIACLTRAIMENPEHYRAYYNLGVAHFRLGHVTEAEQAFQKSIDSSRGTYALPQFAMGVLLFQEQDFTQAEVVIQNGLDVDSSSARGRYLLAWAQFGLNHMVEAEKNIQQALLREANFAGPYFLLARIHQQQNNSPAAVRDLNTYLELDPHGPGSAEAKAYLESTEGEADHHGTDAAMVAKADP